ncbi:MAG: associated Golgi protein [Fibrobacteres bacterium]|nr:associated Golgi protein [Fibrobacterota bacterium]
MKSKILLITLVVLGVIAFNAFLPFKDYLEVAIAWFRALGPLAVVPYVILFVAASVFFVPITGLILAAGTLYGFWMGYLLVAVSGLASIAVTYGLGKRLWRKRVEALRHDHPRFESIYEAISRHGPILVFLIRLNPLLPFSVLNYLFTIPKLDFRKYLLSSFLGLTPDIFFYLYVGHVGKGLLEDPSGLTVWNWVVLGAAVGTTLIAIYIINRLIRTAIPTVPPAPAKSLVST